MGEQVLCVQTGHFKDWLKSHNAPSDTKTAIFVSDLTDKDWEQLSMPFTFIDRDACESDDDYKQLIPYVLCRHNGDFLSYRRTDSTGESRLAQRKSLGLGGHINKSDVTDADTATLNQILRSCAQRELLEELGIGYPASAFKFKGVLYSAMTDVDRKHAGIVTIADFPAPPDVQPRESGIAELEWRTMPQLQREWRNYESWSYLLIGNLTRRTIR